MKTIIYSQSLQNDAFDDIFYNGVYIEKNSNKEINLIDYYARNRVFNFKTILDAETDTKYIYKNDCLLIRVYSEEKDNLGRMSPITIQSPTDEWEELLESLDVFLKKSKRSLSREKLDMIKTAINYAKKRKEDIKNLKIALAIVAITAAVYVATKYIQNKGGL